MGVALHLIRACAEENSDKYRMCASKLTPMWTPPFNGLNVRRNQPTERIKYQTLWTDETWSKDDKMQPILQGNLPEGFCASGYHASSRAVRIEVSVTKGKAQLNPVSSVFGFKMKRVLNKNDDGSKMTSAQLLEPIMGLEAESHALQAELGRFSTAKTAAEIKTQPAISTLKEEYKEDKGSLSQSLLKTSACLKNQENATKE